MIPQGFYRARAASAQFGVTPQKGTDFVRVVFNIVDGEYANQQVTWDGYFTERTTTRTIDALRYCGCMFPGNDATDLTGLGSQDVQIEVEHNTYQAQDGSTKTAPRVKWVNSLDRGVSPELQMDAARKAAFKQKMMGAIIASQQSAAKTGAMPTTNGAPRATAGSGAGEGEDRIPF